MASVETANVGMFHQEDQVCFVEAKRDCESNSPGFIFDQRLACADEGPLDSYLQANSTVSEMYRAEQC
jgi:hypothetical protein